MFSYVGIQTGHGRSMIFVPRFLKTAAVELAFQKIMHHIKLTIHQNNGIN